MTISPKQILKSTFYTHCLYTSNSNNSIDVWRNNQQWSSTNMLWDTRKDDTVLMDSCTITNRILPINITEFTKEVFSEDTLDTESRGLLLKMNTNHFCVLSTSDNSMYTPYVKIELNSLPIFFEKKENINQDLN